MNPTNWSESDKDCNVCGSSVEVGSASSRCSNRDCPTRDRNTSLKTDSTDAEIATFYVRRRARVMDFDRKDIDMGAEELAARAMAGERKCPASLDELVKAAEHLIETCGTTYVGGYEFGWKCGICGEFHDCENVEDGDVLDCDNCENVREVRIQ